MHEICDGMAQTECSEQDARLKPATNLIRSRNYVDLNDHLRDEQREQLRLSRNDMLQQEDAYVNVDTQTSLSFNPQDFDETYDIEPNNASYLESQQLDTEDIENALDETQQNPPPPPATIDDELAAQQDLTQQLDERDTADAGPSLEQQLSALRDLLAIERERNERRRSNNKQLQSYIGHLEVDYLRLQRDLIESLELGHKIKAQKDAQIEALDENIKQKADLIDSLRGQLDATKLEDEFKVLLGKQAQLAQLEKQQLRQQVETTQQQLDKERLSHEQAAQQYESRLENQMQTHERECEEMRKRIEDLHAQINRMMNEPKNLVIKNLQEDKCQLICQIDDYDLSCKQLKAKYDALQKRCTTLVEEFEQTESKRQAEVASLLEQQAEQRRACNELKMQLDDKDELVQIAQFNLQRSEKRCKSLLGTLRSKEVSYKDLIVELESNHEKEVAKLRECSKAADRKLLDLGNELDKKQNDLIKLQLDHTNQIDCLRNDLQQKVNKLLMEKQKIDKDYQAAEVKLARESESKAVLVQANDKLKREVDQFRERSKQLSLDLTKSEAKLHDKQQELSSVVMRLQQARLNNSSNATQQQNAHMELENAKCQVKRLRDTITELKSENEHLCMKLKVSEATLCEASAAVTKEQAKLLIDYERKVKQFKQEHEKFDKNRLKYKHYVHKLKTYCEHLRKVHEHMCNPSACGYQMGTSPFDTVDRCNHEMQ